MTQKRKQPNKGKLRWAEKVLAVLLALLVWELVAKSIGSKLLLVSPWDVVLKLGELAVTGEFWKSIGFTLLRIVIGLVSATTIGTLLAVLAARFRFAETLLWPYMAVVKATPVASFIILCLIWTDSANLAALISFLMVLPVVYTNLLTGIKQTDPKLLEMASVFRMKGTRKIKYIYLPSVKPYFASAMSMAVGLAWKSGTAAEVIGVPDGSIGEKLYLAKIYFDSGELFAWTVVIVVISVLSEKLLSRLLLGKTGKNGKNRKGNRSKQEMPTPIPGKKEANR